MHKRAKTDHAAACQLLADCEAMVAGAKEVHDKWVPPWHATAWAAGFKGCTGRWLGTAAPPPSG